MFTHKFASNMEGLNHDVIVGDGAIGEEERCDLHCAMQITWHIILQSIDFIVEKRWLPCFRSLQITIMIVYFLINPTAFLIYVFNFLFWYNDLNNLFQISVIVMVTEKVVQSTSGNSNLRLTESNFHFPSDRLLYNFTLDNSNSW